MRMIITLVGLLLVGLLVAKQLQSPPAPSVAVESTSEIEVPNVPTRPQDVPQFEQDINSFIDQASQEQARKIEEATNP